MPFQNNLYGENVLILYVLDYKKYTYNMHFWVE